MTDKNPIQRRAVDRAEARVLDLERKLGEEMLRYGATSYNAVINLATAFVDRARERQARGAATDEDTKILQRYHDGRRRSTDSQAQPCRDPKSPNYGTDWESIQQPDFPPG